MFGCRSIVDILSCFCGAGFIFAIMFFSCCIASSLLLLLFVCVAFVILFESGSCDVSNFLVFFVCCDVFCTDSVFAFFSFFSVLLLLLFVFRAFFAPPPLGFFKGLLGLVPVNGAVDCAR